MSPLLRRPSLLVPLLSALVLTLGAASCSLTPDFPTTPSIAPKSVTVRDSLDASGGGARFSQVTVTISWTDGDGDLGILPDNNNTTDYNYYITLYKQKGGTFKPVTTPFSFNGRFPNLNPEGETSTKPFKLRGDLSYKVNTFTVTPPGQIGTIDGIPETLKKGDVIRFDVKIKDRAGNMSNQITTEAVTL